MVDEADASSSMSALAILTCGQNSHPFQERHIPLNESVKIGRSVARARPATDNGIFDCKVLSRNHAMLWYENGTFFLQDTKSSNGTFVNDQRLCKGGEESPPKEIYSGDLIQFGVNVMENNRRGEKITHGCIIATVNLLHPDGREAKPVLLNTPTTGITIQPQDLYKLAQYLQEALHREKMLEQKLASLQELVHNTRESSEGGWQALIDEDRLLSRLEVLENQLHAYSKNHTEDTLRQELITLQEEKLSYETTAKESLMKVLQEKIAATAKLSELERSLSKSEIECGHMREMCERAEEELLNLAEKFQDQLKAVQDIQIQLQDAEAKHMDDIEKLENDKLELNNKLEDMMKQEQMLNVKVDSLQTSEDLSMEHLTTMKVRLDQFKDDNENEHINNLKNADSDSQKFDVENKAVSSVIIPTSVDMDDNKDQLPEDVKGKLKETQQQIEEYKLKLEESESLILESATKLEELQKNLETSRFDSLQYLVKIATLEAQMSERSKETLSSNELLEHLKGQVIKLEQELAVKVPPHDQSLDTTVLCSNLDMVDAATLRPKMRAEDAELEKLLHEAKCLLAKTEDDLRCCKVELNESKLESKHLTEQISALKTELSQVHVTVSEKSQMVMNLQAELQKAENTTKEVKQQILILRDQLKQEQNVTKLDQEKIASLTSALDEERAKLKETLQSLETTKYELEKEKGSHEMMKNLLTGTKSLQSESQPIGIHVQNEATQLSSNELQTLKDECACLRKRIQAIEAEMKMSRKENLQLSSEYNKLEESYKQLQAIKDQLQNRESTWMSNLTDSQKETESSKLELQNAKEEIERLKKHCEDCDKEIAHMKGELKNVTGDYKRICNKSKLISFVSCMPLLMLLFALLLTLYPWVQPLTAATDTET